MSNITNYSVEMLGLPAQCVTGHVGDLVCISGDQTVAVAEPGDTPIGYLRVKDMTLDNWWTVETNRYSKEMTVPFSETIAAGEFVKIGTAVEGVQTFSLWDSEIDPASAIIGICWVGGTADAPGEILI